MTRVAAFLLCASVASPVLGEGLPVLDMAQPYEITGMTDTAVLLVSEGQAYRCALDGDSIGRCDALMPSPAMEAARAEQAALQDALSQAEARETEALRLLATVQSQAGAAQAALTEQLAQTTGALEDEQRRLAEASERLALVEQQLDAMTAERDAGLYRANFRPLVIALERAGVDVGLADEARVSVLARLSILTMAEEFGDGCTLTVQTFTENEREAEQVTITRVLKEFGIEGDLAALMIANLHPEDQDPSLPHNVFKATLAEVLQTGDDDTWDKGTNALNNARRTLNGLGDKIGAKLQDGTLAALSDDRQSLRVLVPPCGG